MSYAPRTDKVSGKERQLLKALYAARGLASVTALDIISAHPVTFAGRSPQGIHQTAASLVRKGMAERDLDSYGYTRYRISGAGEAVLREQPLRLDRGRGAGPDRGRVGDH